MNRIHALLLMCAGALAAATAHAQVPGTLAYQGRLTTSAGAPVNGAQTIGFSLYDVASGGTALWTETQSVTLSNGELSVALGDTVPIPEAIFGKRLYLGIQIGADPEMSPRPRLNAAPYAVRSKNVLQTTLHVPASGTALENGTALKAAAAAVPANGAIVLDGGEYDLGNDNISLGNRVTLRGQGRFTSWVYSSNPVYTVRLQGFQSQVNNLRVSSFAANAVGMSSAAVDIADGASGAAVVDAALYNGSASGTHDGTRIGLRIGDVDGVRVFNSEIQVSNFAAQHYGILAASPGSSSSSLVIDSVTVNVQPNINAPQGTAIAIIDHTNVLLRDVRAFAGGFANFSTALRVQKAIVRVEGSMLQNTSGAPATEHRVVHQIDSELLLLGSELAQFQLTGAKAFGVDASFAPPATRRFLTLKGSTIRSFNTNVAELTGIRSAGTSLGAADSSIETFSTGGAPTKVIGLHALPDGAGAPAGYTILRNTQIDVQHNLSADLGATIITEKSNLTLQHVSLTARDDGIEAGNSGDAGNVNGVLAIYNSKVAAGVSGSSPRYSIRKHLNWGVHARQTEFEQVILAEAGGFLNCMASTRSGGGDTFIANGCPLP